jgi:hypothetical protein
LKQGVHGHHPSCRDALHGKHIHEEIIRTPFSPPVTIMLDMTNAMSGAIKIEMNAMIPAASRGLRRLSEGRRETVLLQGVRCA